MNHLTGVRPRRSTRRQETMVSIRVAAGKGPTELCVGSSRLSKAPKQWPVIIRAQTPKLEMRNPQQEDTSESAALPIEANTKMTKNLYLFFSTDWCLGYLSSICCVRTYPRNEGSITGHVPKGFSPKTAV